MSMILKDFQDEERWEKRELGASEEHVRKVSSEKEQEVDDALELQLVSIRLQKALIADLKELSKDEGIGYQPLIRQILTKYVKGAKHENDKLAAAR